MATREKDPYVRAGYESMKPHSKSIGIETACHRKNLQWREPVPGILSTARHKDKSLLTIISFGGSYDHHPQPMPQS